MYICVLTHYLKVSIASDTAIYTFQSKICQYISLKPWQSNKGQYELTIRYCKAS